MQLKIERVITKRKIYDNQVFTIKK